MNVEAAGIPWYGASDYSEMRALMADAGSLHDTYDAWLAAAEKVKANLEASGVKVIRVPINRQGFIVWCDGEGLPRDSQARSKYASHQAEKMVALLNLRKRTSPPTT